MRNLTKVSNRQHNLTKSNNKISFYFKLHNDDKKKNNDHMTAYNPYFSIQILFYNKKNYETYNKGEELQPI